MGKKRELGRADGDLSLSASARIEGFALERIKRLLAHNLSLESVSSVAPSEHSIACKASHSFLNSGS